MIGAIGAGLFDVYYFGHDVFQNKSIDGVIGIASAIPSGASYRSESLYGDLSYFVCMGRVIGFCHTYGCDIKKFISRIVADDDASRSYLSRP